MSAHWKGLWDTHEATINESKSSKTCNNKSKYPLEKKLIKNVIIVPWPKAETNRDCAFEAVALKLLKSLWKAEDILTIQS